MGDIQYGALIIAILAAFVASSIYYVIFAKQRAAVSEAARKAGKPKPSMALLELTRNALLAGVLLYLVRRIGIDTFVGSVEFSVLLWLAFPFILLSGSVMYEKTPVKLAIIHSGDWAMKLIIMNATLAMWR